MTVLIRSSRNLAASALHLARFLPKVIALALIPMIGLSAGRPVSVDRDGEADEATRSIVYRHYI